MNKSKKLRNILLLFISFSFIKSEMTISINMTDHFNNNFSNLVERTKFKVNKIENYSYLKISIQGTGDGQLTNHIVSYYQDQNYSERKQLSQSIADRTIMWLTKEQIQQEFYFTVKCAIYPCNINVDLIVKNDIELNIEEQYTYYVTEQNKQMSFVLLYSKIEAEKNSYISIWARGNYKITSELKGGKYLNFSSYPYYKIDYEDFNNNKYNLIINGTVGDSINVGSLLFHKYDPYQFYAEFIIKNGFELTDYINGFEAHDLITENFSTTFVDYYDFNNRIMPYSPCIFTDFCGFSYLEENELFYSFHFINDTKYDGQGNNKYSPLLDGIYYLEALEEGTTIGLIPMKPEDNFKYLTYEIFQYFGNISVSINKCQNFPLCHINDEMLQNSEQLNNFYHSYYYTYDNNEYEKDISPISKKQNMLLITCKKGVEYSDDGKNICKANINMKTDTKLINSTDFIKRSPPAHRFIKKNNVDNYYFEGRTSKYYLSVELFDGNIDINISTNNSEQYEIGNKRLFTINENVNITINITGLENSIYVIYYYLNDSNSFPTGSNYLFNLKEEKKIFLNFRVHSFSDEINNPKYFIGIYSFNCSLNIEYNLKGKPFNKNLTKEDDIFQQIASPLLTNDYFYELNITKLNSSDNCLFYASLYKHEIYSFNSDGIPMGNNTPQTFVFNRQNNNYMILSFYQTQKENDAKINFKLKEGTFSTEILINGDSYKKEKIESSKLIQLKSSIIKSKCKDFKYICKILLYIESNEKQKELKLEVTFYSIKGEETINPEEEGTKRKTIDTKILIIMISFGIILLAIIIVVAYFLIKTFKNYKDLAKAVDKISFQEDKENDDDSTGQPLLE